MDIHPYSKGRRNSDNLSLHRKFLHKAEKDISHNSFSFKCCLHLALLEKDS